GGATWIEGVVKGALEVDGTGYVNFGNPTGWPAGKSPRSLCGWGRTNTIASGYRWMAAYGSPGTSQAMFIGMLGSSMIGGGYNGDDVTVTGIWVAGEWQHVGLTYDGTTARLYANGVLVGEVAKNWTLVLNRAFLGEQVNAAGEYWDGAFDDVRLYDHVLDLTEIPGIMAGGDVELAKDPIPQDEATDVVRDVVLSWTAGKYAVTHNVYLGTVFDDVNDAGASDPRGVLAGEDQADTAFDPEGLLEYNQTYYWRVDEVNGAPDYTVFKGDVWSFTTETYAYPITSLTVEASSAQLSSPAIRTIDGSGLDAFDQHGVDLKTMWITPGGLPAWIQYTFDRVYKLDELWIWNCNSELETLMGFGAKDVAIEYSTDGENWTALENVPQFAQGTGKPTYTANTVVDFGEVMAKHVKLTINDNWGATAMVSLSEVRFFYVPVQAFGPAPANGATGVGIDATLNWRPGREATSHEVYFGTDANAVAEGAVTAETVTGHSYTPPAMDLATPYYWRVDEVGNSGTHEGDLWTYTTQEFLVVDDFESYNDDIDAETTIWHAWVDGVTDLASGSQVGYTDPPFAEKTIVRSGGQSMPLQYDNTTFAFSEAKLAFDPPQDWTASGIKTLAIYFAGSAGNGGQLYLKINSTKVVYDGDQADLARFGWQAWNLDLSTVGNVSSVRSLTIGIEGAGTTGILYIDDIRLYPKAPEYITPAMPATTNLVGYYTLDEGSGTKVNDSSGRGHHGTITGTVEWITGMAGSAIVLGGDGDWIDLGNPADWPAGAEPRSMCAWARTDDVLAVWHWIAAYGTGATNQAMFIGLNGTTLYGGGYGNDISVDGLWDVGVWHHIALTYDGTTARLYADGIEVVSAAKTWNLVRNQARIGQQVNTAGEFWNGAVDDVRIYSQTLSPAEVAALAGQTTPRHIPF
ncbi:MAG: LamG-like jellyroll fold domain-containing protein, partial [Phycisphaerales bacterium]